MRASTAWITGSTARSPPRIRSTECSTGRAAPPGFWHRARRPANYGNSADDGYTDFAISATETHIFGPTAINEFRAAWVVHSPNHNGQNSSFNPASLFPQLPIVDNGGLPSMTMTGYTGMFTDYGKGYPYPEYDIELDG